MKFIVKRYQCMSVIDFNIHIFLQIFLKFELYVDVESFALVKNET